MAGRCITLIGMPGAGKSTVGAALAKALDAGFIDTDDVLREVFGEDLPEFIAREGHATFRAREDAIVGALVLNDEVVATGGSVIYGKEAMANLKRQGRVVYLKVAVDEIVRRVQAEPRGIAMLSGATLEEEMVARAALYEAAADVVVECAGLEVEDVVGRIWAVL